MVFNRQRRVPLVTQSLADFLERVRRELRFAENSVTVQLVSDSAMARLNRKFRGKRGSTDVLSFPAAHPRRARGRRKGAGRSSRDTGGSYRGDIAIAPETARRNARRLSRGLPAELRVLILHGMLHLAGYDHETDSGQMERLERRLRRRLKLGVS